MVWFRVDDVITFHPRVLEAGNAAMGLWVRAGAWSAWSGGDVIPHPVVRALGRPRQARRLVEVGLWRETADGFAFEPLLHEIRRPAYREQVPPQLRAAVLDRDGHRCRHCGTFDDLQMDHIYPWSLGGSTTYDNLQALCGPCNRTKGAKV